MAPSGTTTRTWQDAEDERLRKMTMTEALAICLRWGAERSITCQPMGEPGRSDGVTGAAGAAGAAG
jgi:hypothetical protein